MKTFDDLDAVKEGDEFSQIDSDVESKGGGFLGEIYFEFGKFRILAEQEKVIKRILKKVSKGEIIVKGFTDNIGTYKRNSFIAQRRAETVSFIFKKFGVQENRIKTEFFPLSHYKNKNLTSSDRQLNRRAELYLKIGGN